MNLSIPGWLASMRGPALGAKVVFGTTSGAEGRLCCADLATQLGTSERSVRRWVSELADRGVWEVEGRGRGGVSYRLLVDRETGQAVRVSVAPSVEETGQDDREPNPDRLSGFSAKPDSQSGINPPKPGQTDRASPPGPPLINKGSSLPPKVPPPDAGVRWLADEMTHRAKRLRGAGSPKKLGRVRAADEEALDEVLGVARAAGGDLAERLRDWLDRFERDPRFEWFSPGAFRKFVKSKREQLVRPAPPPPPEREDTSGEPTPEEVRKLGERALEVIGGPAKVAALRAPRSEVAHG